jgi:hypothetical protein
MSYRLGELDLIRSLSYPTEERVNLVFKDAKVVLHVLYHMGANSDFTAHDLAGGSAALFPDEIPKNGKRTLAGVELTTQALTRSS